MDERALPALDLRQLHYFVALVEHGTISAAAEALGLAQPSLSENIARLERRLGVQLAVRTGRGIQLTDAGLVLARHARQLVKDAETAIKDIRRAGGEIAGPVSVGIVPSLTLLLAGPLAETVLHEYAQVRLHIAEMMSGELLRQIEEDQLDLGYAYDVAHSAALAIEPLLVEELLLVTAPDNWAGEIGPDGWAVEPIEASELAKFPLVISSWRQGYRQAVERFARANGLTLNIAIEIDSLPQTIGMVTRASAYTLLPHAAVVNQVAAGELAVVAIKDPPLRRTAYLVRHRSRTVTRASMAVESAVKAILADMVQKNRLQVQLLFDT